MEISVVIPIYNGEKFIPELIKNLVDQKFKEFETVFVNDGSIDNSLLILNKELNKTNLIFTIINKQNAGPSSARNDGINAAQGKFVCFVDVDDNIDDKYLLMQYDALTKNQADICFCQMGRYNSKLVTESELKIVSRIDALNMYLRGEFTAGVCNAMYKKILLTNNNILFDPRTKYNEDIHYNWRAIACSESIVLINNALYFYNENQGSSMSRFGNDRYNSIQSFKDLETFFKEKSFDFYDVFLKYGVAKQLWSLTWQSAVKQSKKEYLENIRKYNIKEFMKRLKDFPKSKVRKSSKIFLISPKLFRIFAIIFGKKHTH